MEQLSIITEGDKGAIFSPCRKFRYVLWRIWDAEKGYVNLFV